MKILIADKVSPSMVAGLEALGAEVVSQPNVTAEALPGVIGDARVLIVRSKKVTAEAVAAGKQLSLIVRAGAGVNTIDLDAASRRGTYVANCPGKNTDAVAELAIGLMIACDRGIADATQALRQGSWEKKRFGKSNGLKGRTLGIIGTGSIGMAVVRRAKALDMRVVAWSRSLTAEKAEALDLDYAASPFEVARLADVVSVHVAASAATKGMLGSTFFESMKPGAIFINTARGDVLDTAALRKAIDEKGIKAGLDVFTNEPAADGAFEQTDLASRVVCTPHVGASTEQAEDAIAEEALRVVAVFMQTGVPPNAVNLRTERGAGSTLVLRHYNRVGVLARVLDVLRDEGVNIEDMQNLIFEKGEAACCSIRVDKVPSSAILDQIRQGQDVIELTV